MSPAELKGVIAGLRQRGQSESQILAVLEAMLDVAEVTQATKDAEEQERRARKREQTRERVREHRQRGKQADDTVTRRNTRNALQCVSNVTNVTPPPPSPTPPTTPPISPQELSPQTENAPPAKATTAFKTKLVEEFRGWLLVNYPKREAGSAVGASAERIKTHIKRLVTEAECVALIEEMREAVIRYAAMDHGDGNRFAMQATTFFGPGCRWREVERGEQPRAAVPTATRTWLRDDAERIAVILPVDDCDTPAQHGLLSPDEWTAKYGGDL